MSIIHERAGKDAARSVSHEPGDVQAYRFLVEVTRDDAGIYSAIALNLPGAGSCGGTEEQALERFVEAASGIIESYTEAGEMIPWEVNATVDKLPNDRWITIDV